MELQTYPRATTTDDRLLRGALMVNAEFSTLTGFAMLLFGRQLEDATELPTLALRIVGFGLLGFALAVYIAARRRPIREADGRAIVFADIAWVVVTAILLVAVPDVANTTGTVVMIVVAGIVAVLADVQLVGLRKLRKSGERREA